MFVLLLRIKKAALRRRPSKTRAIGIAVGVSPFLGKRRFQIAPHFPKTVATRRAASAPSEGWRINRPAAMPIIAYRRVALQNRRVRPDGRGGVFAVPREDSPAHSPKMRRLPVLPPRPYPRASATSPLMYTPA